MNRLRQSGIEKQLVRVGVFIKVRLWIDQLSGLDVYWAQTSWKLSTWTCEQKNGFAYDKKNLKTTGLFKASSVSFFIPGGDVS